MRIITKRQRIEGVLDSWKKQYGKDKAKITEALRRLDLKTCPEQDITERIGNNSWTELICYECERDSEIVVRFIERLEDEYESNPCDLCLDCLKKGRRLISKKIKDASGRKEE